nr:MAG TPA: hypothetical protein [Caudoviricetes sp.]
MIFKRPKLQKSCIYFRLLCSLLYTLKYTKKKAQSLVNQSFEPFHTDETPGTRTRDNLIKSHSIFSI